MLRLKFTLIQRTSIIINKAEKYFNCLLRQTIDMNLLKPDFLPRENQMFVCQRRLNITTIQFHFCIDPCASLVSSLKT